MIRLRQWLALFVLSAPYKKPCLDALGLIFFSVIIAFASCIPKECDCFITKCFTDNSPPEPIIEFSLVDTNGKTWSEVHRDDYIDTLKVLNEQKKELTWIDTTRTLGCSRLICMKFNETPSFETVGKFIKHKYFMDIHFKWRGWDRDTIEVSYKTDSNDCTLDSITFVYNNKTIFTGMNRSNGKNRGFDYFNFITKL